MGGGGGGGGGGGPLSAPSREASLVAGSTAAASVRMNLTVLQAWY